MHLPFDSLVILGAASGAREMYWFIQELKPSVAIIFVEDVTEVTELTIRGRRFPVVKDWRFETFRRELGHEFVYFLATTSRPGDRAILVEKALDAGLKPAPTIVHPRAYVSPTSELGQGGFIWPGAIVSFETVLGDYAQLLPNTALGHDCVTGPFLSMHTGSTVNGYVTLGAKVEIGSGAVVNNGKRIADGVRVGAQACVTRDILEPDITVFGIPARNRAQTSPSGAHGAPEGSNA